MKPIFRTINVVTFSIAIGLCVLGVLIGLLYYSTYTQKNILSYLPSADTIVYSENITPEALQTLQDMIPEIPIKKISLPKEVIAIFAIQKYNEIITGYVIPSQASNVYANFSQSIGRYTLVTDKEIKLTEDVQNSLRNNVNFSILHSYIHNDKMWTYVHMPVNVPVKIWQPEIQMAIHTTSNSIAFDTIANNTIVPNSFTAYNTFISNSDFVYTKNVPTFMRYLQSTLSVAEKGTQVAVLEHMWQSVVGEQSTLQYDLAPLLKTSASVEFLNKENNMQFVIQGTQENPHVLDVLDTIHASFIQSHLQAERIPRNLSDAFSLTTVALPSKKNQTVRNTIGEWNLQTSNANGVDITTGERSNQWFVSNIPLISIKEGLQNNITLDSYTALQSNATVAFGSTHIFDWFNKTIQQKYALWQIEDFTNMRRISLLDK